MQIVMTNKKSRRIFVAWTNHRGKTLQTDCSRVATKIFEDFGGVLNKAFIRDQEPVSIVHYTRPGSCIKQPTQNYEAALRHVNWPGFNLKVAPKSPSPSITDP